MSKIEKQRDGLYSLDGGNGAALSIGDPSGSRVTPRLRAEKWAGSRWGSCWLDLVARDVEPDVAAERLRTIKGKDALEIETVRTHGGGNKKSEVHRLIAGSTEWDIYWPAVKDMPRDEVSYQGVRYYRILFSVATSPGVQWHPQPALTQQEIDHGDYRPEKVVNSYALYGQIEGDYYRRDGTLREARETGKLAHYYRSKFTVANGDWTWCLDLLDAITATMAVLIPADFVDSCNPNGDGELDPTFGYTSKGASTLTNTAADYMTTARHQSTTAGSATAMYYWTSGTSRLCVLALYAAKAGEENKPYTLLAQTASGIASSTDGWSGGAFGTPYDITATTYYHLGQNHGGGPYDLHYDSVANFFYDQDAEAYPSVPSPFVSAANLDNYKISAKVDYTEPSTDIETGLIGGKLIRGGILRRGLVR